MYTSIFLTFERRFLRRHGAGTPHSVVMSQVILFNIILEHVMIKCAVFLRFYAMFGMKPKSPKNHVIRGDRVKSEITKYATTSLNKLIQGEWKNTVPSQSYRTFKSKKNIQLHC